MSTETGSTPFTDDLLGQVRERFAHVASDPIAGERIFLESGGGSLTLRSVLERTNEIAALPDSASRPNATARHLADVIARGTADVRTFLGGDGGRIVTAATGTDLLFRLVRSVLLASGEGSVVSSKLEHPASYHSAQHWAAHEGREWIEVPIRAESASVAADDYARAVRPDTVLATVIHASHVTGMRVDLAGIVRAIREVSPECYVVCDGIQHAAHAPIDAPASGVDAYVFAPYKAFSRHGCAFGWLSPRLAALPHEQLQGKAPDDWDLGQRDAAAFAAQSEVQAYLAWLGGHFTNAADDRAMVEAAMGAVQRHEAALIARLIGGADGLPGLSELPGVRLIGGPALAGRQGAVSFSVQGRPSPDVVEALEARGIRCYFRADDPYSGHILRSVGHPDCVRVSFAHYNTPGEVDAFLRALAEVLGS